MSPININSGFSTLQNSYNREGLKSNEKSTNDFGAKKFSTHGFSSINQSQFSNILSLISNLIEQLSQYQGDSSDTGSSTDSGTDGGNIGTDDGGGDIGIDPGGSGQQEPNCKACTPKTVSITADANNTSPNPSFDPNDISVIQDYTEPFGGPKGFGDTRSDRTFLHTFDTTNLGLDLSKTPTSGKLILEISGGSGNDSVLMIEDDTGFDQGTAGPNLQQHNLNETLGSQRKTIEIELNAASLESIKDGDFSFLVDDDTTVYSATLEIDGFKPSERQVGTNSDDTLNGKSQTTDIINGRDGDDIIDGKSGDDCLYGDKGDDIVRGGSGNDNVHGGDGDDNVSGGSGRDHVFGGNGDDKMHGGSGNDDLNGDSGNDTISGGSGKDRIDGGTGDDIINGGSGDDILLGRQGDDTINGGSGNDQIYGGRGDNILNGGTGNDDIFLDFNSKNIVDGGSGDDSIRSNLGASALNNNTKIQNEIDGGNGQNDIIKYFGDRSDYDISPIPGTSPNNEYTITHIASNTVDLIKNIELLEFDTGPNEPL